MKYLTHSVVALVFVSLVAAPSANAQVAGTPTVASLYAQLAALQAQLAALKGDAAPMAAANSAAEDDVTVAEVASTKRPTISGTADGMKKVYVTVTKDGAKKPAYKKSVAVKRDAWKTRVSRNLADGTYAVNVYASSRADEALASTTLTVGKKAAGTKSVAASAGTFSVSLVPLLMGGTARAGQAVPVSYLKVVNAGKAEATLTGVTLSQKGSAPASAISSLTIKDDKDGSQGQVSVSGTTATVPTTSVFAPGQMKLFTLKAVLGTGAAAHAGKTLQYEVTGVSGGKGAFPIRGTTWTIGF